MFYSCVSIYCNVKKWLSSYCLDLFYVQLLLPKIILSFWIYPIFKQQNIKLKYKNLISEYGKLFCIISAHISSTTRIKGYGFDPHFNEHACSAIVTYTSFFDGSKGNDKHTIQRLMILTTPFVILIETIVLQRIVVRFCRWIVLKLTPYLHV